MASARQRSFEAYFSRQLGGGGASLVSWGGGGPSFGSFYRSSIPYQTGRGIGSWLRGLWSFFKPSLAQGLQTLGNQALSTGGQILQDYALPENRARGTEPLKDRLKEGWTSVKTRLQQGRGMRRSDRQCVRRLGTARTQRALLLPGRASPAVRRGAPAPRRSTKRNQAAALDVF